MAQHFRDKCSLRKPFSSSVSDNVVETNCGAINIDGCRIGREKRTYKGSGTSQMRYADHRAGLTDGRGKELEFSVEGRFPSNFIYERLVQPILDQQGGWRKSGDMASVAKGTGKVNRCYGKQYSRPVFSEGSEGFVSRYIKVIE